MLGSPPEHTVDERIFQDVIHGLANVLCTNTPLVSSQCVDDDAVERFGMRAIGIADKSSIVIEYYLPAPVVTIVGVEVVH